MKISRNDLISMRWVASTACPFLYQTKTIQRGFRSQTSHYSEHQAVRSFSNEAHTDKRDELSAQGSIGSSNRQASPSSTLTSAERQAFETLQAKNDAKLRSGHFTREHAAVESNSSLISEPDDLARIIRKVEVDGFTSNETLQLSSRARYEQLSHLAASFDTDPENIVELFMPDTRRVKLEQYIDVSLGDIDGIIDTETVHHNFSAFSTPDETNGSVAQGDQEDQETSTFDSFGAQREDSPTTAYENIEAESTAVPESVESPFGLPQIRLAVLEALRSIEGRTAQIIDEASSSHNPNIAITSVFSIFEHEILSLVDLLQSSSVPQSHPRPSLHQLKVSDVPSNDLPECLKVIRKDVHLLPLITTLYPSATLFILRLLASTYPWSNIFQALLPRIKEHGPISYLLAGNIYFKTTLARAMWKVYNDVAGVVALLGPSTRDGTGIKEETVQLLELIIRARESDFIAAEGGKTVGRSPLWWKLPVQQDAYHRILYILDNPSYAEAGTLAEYTKEYVPRAMRRRHDWTRVERGRESERDRAIA